VFNGAVMAGGLLGGREPRIVQPGPHKAPPYGQNKESTDRAQALWEFATARGTSLLALNLQFCLREERIASTLVGAQTPEEVAQDVAAVSEPIGGDVWRELRERFGL
jgi:L-glyceraldehyde 3-phosphate reductase